MARFGECSEYGPFQAPVQRLQGFLPGNAGHGNRSPQVAIAAQPGSGVRREEACWATARSLTSSAAGGEDLADGR